MSAYTVLSRQALQAFLAGYAVGELLDCQAIQDGIENSNYFVHTGQGDYVLTLFESLPAPSLPPYLSLMTQLASRGLPCPCPVPDQHGGLLGELHGKPALLAPRLPGASAADPSAEHCRAIGSALAAVHRLSQRLPTLPDNPCGVDWFCLTADKLRLDAEESALLSDELAFQGKQDRANLPRGLVHGDLFRDNALFEGGRLSGLLDWYEASTDAWLYDVAVTINDWCGDDPARVSALLDGYHSTRELTEAERDALPAMLRTAALRFWLSRLLNRQEPRAGHLVLNKEPNEFKHILLRRRAMHARLV